MLAEAWLPQFFIACPPRLILDACYGCISRKGRLMKLTLDNGIKTLSLISFCLLAVSTAHDWAFFRSFGQKFQSIQTTFDYISHAIEWLPALVALLGVQVLFELFTLQRRMGELEPDSGFENFQLKKQKLVFKWISRFLFAAGLAFLLFASVSAFYVDLIMA